MNNNNPVPQDPWTLPKKVLAYTRLVPDRKVFEAPPPRWMTKEWDEEQRLWKWSETQKRINDLKSNLP